MTRAGAIVFLLSLAVCGCRTAENVASTSAAFITAPAHYVSRKLGGEQTTTETTDTTVYENQPVETTPPPPQPTPARSPRTITSTTTASSPPQQNEAHPPASATSHPVTPQSSSTNSAAQFPVAKPVPGKPGYVFSPYDPNGGYVDVSGYPSGSKVKDPYSQKIFLVP
jgi:hypothetical protein